MTLGSCPREKEVADLLHRGHWPQACPADLRAHVDACRSCSELVLVTQAFQSARANADWPRAVLSPPARSGGAPNSAAAMPRSSASASPSSARKSSPWE